MNLKLYYSIVYRQIKSLNEPGKGDDCYVLDTLNNLGMSYSSNPFEENPREGLKGSKTPHCSCYQKALDYILSY